MGVVVVQSKPVAQVYRLFGALVTLLLVMVIGFSIARWRSAQTTGSPYGGLAPVAGSAKPVSVATAPMAALVAAPPSTAIATLASTPAPTNATPVAATPVVAQAAPVVAQADPVAQPAAPAADMPRTAPRVIGLEKVAIGAAPLPAPPAAVAAATASQAAPPRIPASNPVAVVAAAPAANPGPVRTTGGTININTASADMLDHLPGAGRIGRTIVRHRPYGSVQDLVANRVLRAGDFARIRSYISAN